MKWKHPGPDLFEHAEAQREVPALAAESQASAVPDPSPAEIVCFWDKRQTLPRFILNQPPPFFYQDREIARKRGLLPPAPIINFARAEQPSRPDPVQPNTPMTRSGT